MYWCVNYHKVAIGFVLIVLLDSSDKIKFFVIIEKINTVNIIVMQEYGINYDN